MITRRQYVFLKRGLNCPPCKNMVSYLHENLKNIVGRPRYSESVIEAELRELEKGNYINIGGSMLWVSVEAKGKAAVEEYYKLVFTVCTKWIIKELLIPATVAAITAILIS